ncbi:MAG TPA: site-specific integrase [Verrucomicrobiae bacterium]|nr:site-specific integrase [Verrucomicrobiae bacterium]
MKTENFPLIITAQGVSAKIRKIVQTKKGNEYIFYMVDYVLLGKRKQEWHTDLVEAKKAASDACKKIASGEQRVLELRNDDRLAYIRAIDALANINVPIDVAAARYAEAHRQLAQTTGDVIEAARQYARQHAGVVQKSVADAVTELLEQIKTEQKNTVNGTRRKDAWLKLLRSHLQEKLALSFQCKVNDLSSSNLGLWLISLKLAERTRRNVRDCVAFFLKWAKGRNYLSKDADPLANVQQFRKRKRGAVKIISADVLVQLLIHAPEDFIPYLALRAFAGLRDCEAKALDWKHVDMKARRIEITDEIAKQADDEEGVARTVKIRPVLAEWLRPYAQKSGPICPYANSVKKLGKIKRAAKVTVPRNALRHTFISAAVTLSNDLNAVAIEAGNSPTVIKQSYWNRKMNPREARAWFKAARARVAAEKASTANIVAVSEELKVAA